MFASKRSAGRAASYWAAVISEVIGKMRTGRRNFRDRILKNGFGTQQNNLEPAQNPPTSLLRRDRRVRVETLWDTAKAEPT